jgi:hypothetical protein
VPELVNDAQDIINTLPNSVKITFFIVLKI